MDNTLILILAGGRSKKMDIFCRHKAKPAMTFAGNKRIIDYVLSNCLHSKCSNIAVLIDYQRASLSSYLERWAISNFNGKNLHILEPKYGTYQGNADAVYQNLDFLRRHSFDLVMVIAGDMIYKMDYSKILGCHRKSGADATICTSRVPIEQAYRYGVITTDDNARVISFLEKPEIPQSNTVSMSIYVFNKHILIEALSEDAFIASSPHDFGHAILPRMVRRKKVNAYSFDGYWRDIGTPQIYYEANMDMLPDKPVIFPKDDWTVVTEAENLNPPRFFAKGCAQNSIVSAGCVIKGQVLNSVLSPGVWVEEEAVVRDSIIMANSFVGFHSVVDHCVLSEGVNVGRLCYLGFGGSVLNGEGVTVLGDQVTVPPHTAIGRNCRVLPHSGLTDFTRKVIPPESVVSPLPVPRSFNADNTSRDVRHQRAFGPAD